MELPTDYICEGQMTIWDCMTDATPLKFDSKRKLRLIELFGGIGSQAMSLRNIGVEFEHYRVVEFDKYAIASYNAIHDTDFPTIDITQISGKDLGIVEKHKYQYLMTYSFPCTDLSISGRMLGMEEGSGTRSSLLWEVKRLLEESDALPDILMMENVPQVHSKQNINSFKRWLKFLESRGYTTVYQDLNAKNYGVAQSRNRCFAISFLGNHTYKFPKEIPLDNTMVDYLEDEVDEKYYISNEKAKVLIDSLILNGKIIQNRTEQNRTEQNRTEQNRTEQLLTSQQTDLMSSMSQTVSQEIMTEESAQESLKEVECARYTAYMNYKHYSKINPEVATTLCARDANGFGCGNQEQNGVIECKKLT